MSRANRIIFHVDIDAFYTSVEIKQNSSLKDLPVVIGADPERGKGRGVVITCSYEARQFGLKSGMPISRAYKLCPNAIYLRPNFELYGYASYRIMKILQSYADDFEQSGIDEAFLDVSSSVRNTDEAKELALAIKKRLNVTEGLTCSIGIAPNKSSAKIASDLQKPDGLTIVPFDKVSEFLAPLPVTVISGVGKKTQTFLKERRIEKIVQLQEVPGKQLLNWFGKTGVWLWGVVHGKEEIPVKPRETPKSLNVEKTFRKDVTEFKLLYKEIDEISYELIRRLKLGNLKFKTIGIKIRFHGFETYTREKSFSEYSDNIDLLQSITKSLLDEFENKGKSVRLLGVRVSDLKRGYPHLSTLDSWV
jgi:DNA polymerase IV (DinB-like DNA polymerase)